MDKITMTEEQADDLVLDCVLPEHRKFVYKELKERGYIKKSDLEIAREEWEAIGSRSIDNGVIFVTAQNLIDLQEKEIERLKNE